MTKRRLVFVTLIFAVLAFVGFFVWLYYLRNKPAAILIESQPVSQVYIDGEKVGLTPFEGEYNPGEVRIKLIPQSLEMALVPYEAKIYLESGVKTIVRRKLGEIEGEGSGLIISFKKTDINETSVSVVTKPDAAQIFIDGSFVDVSPTKQTVAPGEHELKVDAEGYHENSLTIQTTSRYDLTAVVELERNDSERVSEGEKKDNDVEKITILSTPIGYLRVRASDSTEAEEVAQLQPGEEYELLEENDNKDWYKIKVSEDEEGWIFAEYATKSADIKLSE